MDFIQHIFESLCVSDKNKQHVLYVSELSVTDVSSIINLLMIETSGLP